MKFLVVLVALCASVLVKGELNPSIRYPEDMIRDGGKIIQGQQAAEGQFPWAVRLQMTLSGGTGLCGGSLISTKHVLTAAHCLVAASSLNVLMGSIDSSNPSLTMTTAKMTTHPDFDPYDLNNDIALAELPQDVPVSSNIRPVRLPKWSQTSDDFAGTVATVAGWGRTINLGLQSRYLRFVDLTIIPNAVCRRNFTVVINSTICGVGIESPAQGSCNGDSGGPFTQADTDGQPMQVGIVSFGSSLGCSSDFPSGFVRPHFFWPWISQWTGIPIRE